MKQGDILTQFFFQDMCQLPSGFHFAQFVLPITLSPFQSQDLAPRSDAESSIDVKPEWMSAEH
jgi:hypothetical protein